MTQMWKYYIQKKKKCMEIESFESDIICAMSITIIYNIRNNRYVLNHYGKKYTFWIINHDCLGNYYG